MRKNNNEFQKKKQVILFLFGYACQSCGVISTANHVHHVDHNNGNNDAFNLIPLCGDCHKLFHKLQITIKPEYSATLCDQVSLLNSFF